MKTLKSTLRILFPFIDIFKTLKLVLKDFDFWDSNIGWAIKLYTLTTVIPICGTAMIILLSILGKDMIYPFFEGICGVWCGFYVTGTFLDIAACRWQILLLVISFFLTISQKN